MGKGAYIAILNHADVDLDVSYSNIKGIHVNGEEGSDFRPITGWLPAVAQLPQKYPEQYIEATIWGETRFVMNFSLYGKKAASITFIEKDEKWSVEANGMKVYDPAISMTDPEISRGTQDRIHVAVNRAASPPAGSEGLLEALHCAAYTAKESLPQVRRKFSGTTVLKMAKMLADEYNNSLISREDAMEALLACGYDPMEVDCAVHEIFGGYGACLKNHAYLKAAFPYNGAYDICKDDFTLEAWVKPEGSGTIVAHKINMGGGDDWSGGFLLVLAPNGSFKLVTDNGVGYFELVSDKTGVFDGRWHHIAGVRQQKNLALYLDGTPLVGRINGNQDPPLHVRCTGPLYIGYTEQEQERWRNYSGLISDVRLWTCARTQEEIKVNANKKLNGSEKGLVGYWNFDTRDGTDLSPTRNNMKPCGDISYVLRKPGNSSLNE